MSTSSSMVPITDAATLADWIARSSREPVLLFKHSLTCGTSAAAHEEVEQFLAANRDGLACGLIVVQTHRSISNELAVWSGVAHHTPQALLVVDGRVRWSASHWRITADALARAAVDLQSAQAST